MAGTTLAEICFQIVQNFDVEMHVCYVVVDVYILFVFQKLCVDAKHLVSIKHLLVFSFFKMFALHLLLVN